MMVMMVVVMMMSAIPGRHDHAGIVAVMMPIEAMVMMVVMMMVELSHLDVFSRLSWSGFVNGLQKCDGIRDRLQQVGV
jgi:hypothetical protein